MVLKDLCFAKVEMGKKYYFVYEGTLRAIVFNKIVLTEEEDVLYHVDIAGMGKKVLRNADSVYCLAEVSPKGKHKVSLNIAKMWHSAEDYLKNKSIETGKAHLSEVLEESMPWLKVKLCRYPYSGYLSVIGYSWDGVDTVEENLLLPPTIIMDENGISVNRDVLKALNPMAYFSEEECRRNNQIKIIDFD